MTKLCRFSHDNPPFSAFEHHAERINANGFIEKTALALKLSRFEPTGLSHLGTMLEEYHKLQPKHKTTDELKVALQTIWEEMP